MGFLEFLGKADMSTLSRFGVLDTVMSTGIFGLITLFLGLAAFVTAFYGLVVKPKTLAPMILGLLSLAMGVGASYIGYSIASGRVASVGGWSALSQEELVDGASFCIVTVYMGGIGLLLGFLGSMANAAVSAYKKREEEE